MARASSIRSVRRAAVWLAAAAALCALVSGCASARNALGTANSGCYVALPEASAAVNGAGHLQGVRLVSVASLRHTGRLYALATSEPRRHVSQVCLVAFTGPFRASEVHQPHGRSAGRLAIVVLEYPDNTLLGTIILRRVPLHFGHSHLGS
jgi:hypothetical protein